MAKDDPKPSFRQSCFAIAFDEVLQTWCSPKRPSLEPAAYCEGRLKFLMLYGDSMRLRLFVRMGVRCGQDANAGLVLGILLPRFEGPAKRLLVAMAGNERECHADRVKKDP